MKKLRVGIIGINGIGKQHVRLTNGNEQCELTAVVDIEKEAVSRVAEECGARAFTDYKTMLNAGLVDAVIIAVPHHLHTEMGLACLEAGIHVLMEKPLANRVSEADLLIAAARKRNLKLGVAHQYREHRLSKEMKRVIDSGEIGRILRVLWTWALFRSEAYYRRDTWRRSWSRSGGGVLMYHAIHDLDLVSWMVGKPVEISAMVANQLHEPELDDIASASILFENGAVGTFQATINQPQAYSVRQIAGDRGMIFLQDVRGLIDDYGETMQVGSFEDSLGVMTEKLTSHFTQPGVRWETLSWQDRRKASYWERGVNKFKRVVLRKTPPARPSPRAILVNNFFDAILKGDELIVPGESALTAVEIVNACILSGLKKKTVKLPLDREEYECLFMELNNGASRIPRLR
jgi:predicted dehydrogenase